MPCHTSTIAVYQSKLLSQQVGVQGSLQPIPSSSFATQSDETSLPPPCYHQDLLLTYEICVQIKDEICQLKSEVSINSLPQSVPSDLRLVVGHELHTLKDEVASLHAIVSSF